MGNCIFSSNVFRLVTILSGNFAAMNFSAIISLPVSEIENAWRQLLRKNSSKTPLHITNVLGVRITTSGNISAKSVLANKVLRNAIPLAFPPSEPFPSFIKAFWESNRV